MYGIVLGLTGIMLYAFFSLEECDPYLSGVIGNRNQVSIKQVICEHMFFTHEYS